MGATGSVNVSFYIPRTAIKIVDNFSGSAIQNAAVSITSTTTATERTLYTGPNGIVFFDYLDGDCNMEIYAPGMFARKMTISSDQINKGSSSPIVVRMYNHLNLLIVKSNAAGVDEPVPGAMVYTTNPPPLRYILADTYGKVDYYANNNVTYTLSILDMRNDYTSPDITITADQIANYAGDTIVINIDASSDSGTGFTILNEANDEPIPGAIVIINGVTKTSDSDGKVVFDIPAGQAVTVNVSATGYNAKQLNISAMQIEDAGSNPILINLSPVGGDVTFIASNINSGNPISGALVRISKIVTRIVDMFNPILGISVPTEVITETNVRTYTTGSDGKVTCSLEDGQYKISITCSGYLFSEGYITI